MKLFISTFVLTLMVDYAISDARISGGHRVTIEEAPYFAHVTHDNPNGGNSICSGSILRKNFILTAAHCKFLLHSLVPYHSPLFRYHPSGVTNKHNNFTTFDPDIFEINIETVLRHHGKKLRVKKVHAHPEFDGKADNYHHDIGILELEDDITFNNKAQPVTLPDENYTPAAGSDVILSGSGDNPDNPEDSKERLYQVELQVITAKECYKYHHRGHSVDELEKHEICAKGKGRKSGKGGDSGGPLIEESTKKIVGVVSYGKPHAPTVFCKISDNLDFINGVINRNGPQSVTSDEAPPPSPPDSVWQQLYRLLKPYMSTSTSTSTGPNDDWSDDV